MRYDDYVVIVPILKQRVLIQRQYKPGAQKVCWGFPAGFRKKKESFLGSAKRELLEETGLSGKMKNVGTWFDNASVGKEKFSIFLCSVQSELKSFQNPDSGESAVQNLWVPVKNLDRYKMDGACMALAQALIQRKPILTF